MDNKELVMLQSLPLEIKVAKSKLRILEWIRPYGRDGVYISFSGGKDSTVLLHLVREVEKEYYGDSIIPAVFSDTGLEFPEIKKFVNSFNNVVTIRPKLSFKQVLERYGYPVVSKEQSNYIYRIRNTKSMGEFNQYFHGISRDGRKSRFKIAEKNKYLLDAPFLISDKCCDKMKKNPIKQYEKNTGRVPFIGTMAHESQQRKLVYLRNGCNAFDSSKPKSTPIAFWLEQDILSYIKEHNIEICSVYGDIKPDSEGKLYTTGERRTGCVYCMYGIENEGSNNRFTRLEKTHSDLHKYCMETLGFKEVCEFMDIPYSSKEVE